MNEAVQHFAPVRIVEYDRTELLPVYFSVRGQNILSERFDYPRVGRAALGSRLPRKFICIEYGISLSFYISRCRRSSVGNPVGKSNDAVHSITSGILYSRTYSALQSLLSSRRCRSLRIFSSDIF